LKLLPVRGRWIVAGLATAALVAVTAGPAAANALRPAAAPAPAPDKTSPAEAARVDRVPAPKLDWYTCFDMVQCATAKLPLDYDDPTGPTTELALVRVKAKDQKHRVGTLFVNPGGPGGSATMMADFAPMWLDPSVLAKFDVVGVDPRGIGFSANVQCFPSPKEQAPIFDKLQVAFPVTAKEQAAYIDAARKVGKACSSTGATLAGAMSTAEDARDMEVLRRSVGDKKLSYLGFSYGTALGQYYANLFPDRVRAVVIDGVVNPLAWVGTPATADEPVGDRMRSPDGAYKALREILVRCDKAGGLTCEFAAGDPVKNFDVTAQRLKAKPLVLDDPDLGQSTVTYADFIGLMLGVLYSPNGYLDVVSTAQQLYVMTEPPAKTSAAARKAATKKLVGQIRKARQLGYGFPYFNDLDAFASVECTDTLAARDAGQWPALAAAADKRAPYFGSPWGWSSVWCASNTWTVQDEDAYRGPFNRRTVAPVLVVGDYWDPATNYSSAVAVSKLLPNSRLLSSDSWGHTAYGTSLCVTDAVDKYLLKGTLPAKGKVCKGDVQPFAAPPPVAAQRSLAAAVANPLRRAVTTQGVAIPGRLVPGRARMLPPVAVMTPVSSLNGTRR
jgi:pimeloyl-ACP methyl ester carboxylesterase